MQQLDLGKVREAAQAVLSELDIIRENDRPHLKVHIDTHNDLRASVDSLTAHLALSDYDRCLQLLVSEMGCGAHHDSIAQNADGTIKSFDRSGACPSPLRGGTWYGNGMERGYRLTLPMCPDGWESSRRFIRSGSLVKGVEG